MKINLKIMTLNYFLFHLARSLAVSQEEDHRSWYQDIPTVQHQPRSLHQEGHQGWVPTARRGLESRPRCPSHPKTSCRTEQKAVDRSGVEGRSCRRPGGHISQPGHGSGLPQLRHLPAHAALAALPAECGLWFRQPRLKPTRCQRHKTCFFVTDGGPI